MTPATFTFSSVIPASSRAVFRWHHRADALIDLLPQSRFIRIDRRQGGIRDGGRVVFSFGVGPLRLKWDARHFGYVHDVRFCDEQVRGPFRFWRHTHRVEAIGDDVCLLVDEIEYVLPGGCLSHRVAGAFVQRMLHAAFTERHAITRSRVLALSSRRAARSRRGVVGPPRDPLDQ
jgi:uncharacterized protein